MVPIGRSKLRPFSRKAAVPLPFCPNVYQSQRGDTLCVHGTKPSPWIYSTRDKLRRPFGEALEAEVRPTKSLLLDKIHQIAFLTPILLPYHSIPSILDAQLVCTSLNKTSEPLECVVVAHGIKKWLHNADMEGAGEGQTNDMFIFIAL